MGGPKLLTLYVLKVATEIEKTKEVRTEKKGLFVKMKKNFIILPTQDVSEEKASDDFLS